MTEKTFSMATMKVKLESKQTLSAKLTADARMTAEMDLLLKGDKGEKGDKGDRGEIIASAYCNPDGTMVLEMDSGRRVSTGLQPLQDCIGYAESAKESADAAASSQSAAAGSESAAASSASVSASSASAAKTSETNAKASETNAAGSKSAAASSASAAASSASAAASSQSAAKTSETNAKTSENNAAKSASAAAASARTRQADWSETDNTLQSYIKGKPTNLLTTNTTQTITADKAFTGAVTVATVNATSLTVTGPTSVPTANADNNSKTVANTAFVKTAIANLVNGAPSQLDTLRELSAALGNDANFSATVAKKIGEKVSKSGDSITGPILYEKAPNDDSELINKAYVDSAIKALRAEMKTAMLALFPVGTVLETTNSANPSTYIGGTWELLPAGLTTISAGTYTETHNVNGTNVTDTYVFTAGSSEFTVNGTKTKGEAKHQITEGELTQHGHLVRTWNKVNSGKPKVFNTSWVDYQNSSYFQVSGSWGTYDNQAPQFGMGDPAGTTGPFGGNQPHNSIQPVYGAYKFRRIT